MHNTNELLEKAASICLNAHKGKTDKGGYPYFMHPFRVAMKCATTDEKIVALLHDTIEDAGITADYLLDEGFSSEIIDAVISVTKRDEPYSEFIKRAASNKIGRIVKLRDIEDNLDISRLKELDSHSAERLNKYLEARDYLLNYSLSEEYEQSEESSEKKPPLQNKFKSINDLYREDRLKIKRYIERRLVDDKSMKPLGQDTIMVTWHNHPGIQHTAAINTFIEVIRKLGYERVEALNILYQGKYPIVISGEGSAKYKEATAGRWILSNCPNKFKALFINQIADELNIPLKCELISKQ